MNMTLNALPDFRSQENSYQRLLMEQQDRIQALEEELRQEKAKHRAMAELKITLTPLYKALQMVFGHLDTMGVDPSAPGPSKHAAAWDSWKKKLKGLNAQAIDVLLLHGPMNQTQLRIQLSCASRSVTNIVGTLNKAGLINKVDGKIGLKEL
jgi:hypothetical protein